MIGYLRGQLAGKKAPMVVLDVHGVGYELDVPLSTFYQLPEAGEQITLLTHLAIREDAHTLFGFATEAERALFRSLIRVSGIGTRMALVILSGISVHDFYDCVQHQDIVRLVRLPGIGKKTAERLLIELRDRLPEYAPQPTQVSGLRAGSADGDASIATVKLLKETPLQEANSALQSLGFKPQEAGQLLAPWAAESLTAEELIRMALQSTVKK